MKSVETIEDAESFMIKHGEKIVDTLGGEVDRIEKNLKVKHVTTGIRSRVYPDAENLHN